MTIINNVGVEKNFDNLTVGMVFKSRDNYYMVINEAKELIEDEDIDDCPIINAINLATGNSTHFSFMDKVTVIKNPKLVIE